MAPDSSKTCPICLEPVSGEAFLDPCFHKFCYHCILQWSEMVAAHPPLDAQPFFECPLCKTRSLCIIHNVVLGTFQRHYLFGSQTAHAPFLLSQLHYRRLAVYRQNLRRKVPEESQHRIKRRRKGLVVAGNSSLKCWVQRELQALLQEEDVGIVTQHVIGVLEFFEKRQKLDPATPITWKNVLSDAVRPFIDEDAEKFSEEIENFIFSGLSIAAYDNLAEESVTASTLPAMNC